MDFNTLLNEYSLKKMSEQELNEKAENLAKALVTNTSSYGLTPTAVSYTGFEKQGGLKPSPKVAEKDLEDLNAQLKKETLSPLVRHPKLSFKEVKGAFQQRFSGGSYFNGEVKDFTDEVAKILKVKPAEYDEIAKKKFEEKKPVVDDAVVRKVMDIIVKNAAEEMIPEFTIQYDRLESSGKEIIKNNLRKLTNNLAIIKDEERKANSAERGSLTTRLNTSIVEFLKNNIDYNSIVEEYLEKKDWSSLILGLLEDCTHLISSKKAVDIIKENLITIVTEAAMKKNDIIVTNKQGKSLRLEIKGGPDKPVGRLKLFDLAILSPHKRTIADLKDFFVRKGFDIKTYNRLVKVGYGNFIKAITDIKLHGAIKLSKPIYIYNTNSNSGGEVIYCPDFIFINSVGVESKYIQVSVSRDPRITLKDALKREGVIQ